MSHDALPAGLPAVDELDVLVIVDNTTDSLSSALRGITNENEVLRAAGMRTLSGAAKCCAQHGLSLLLNARVGNDTHCLLFDAGPEAYTFSRNVARLKPALDRVDAMVLSHGHWDHAGGMLEAVRHVHAARGGSPLELHVNDGMFVERANTLADGSVLPYEKLPSYAELEQAGARVVNSPEARTIAGVYYLSGEIPRRTEYEAGYPGHLMRSAPDAHWQPDPWLMDERYVAVRVRDRGVVVFSACSHAGVVNVLLDARERFHSDRLHAVMGGLHLAGPKVEPIIDRTVADLAMFDLERIVPGHCSGWRAVNALIGKFGAERVAPSAVGRRFLF